MLVRLQKLLADAGVASRRASEKLISEGRVLVNGQPVTQLGVKVDPERDRVEVGGRVLRPAEERVYVILNKPRGYVSTVKDPEGRRTVLELIGHVGVRLYPVGRLDMDTEGLLLLTNDGGLTNALLHPRQEVPKTYVAEVDGLPTPETLARLRRGIRLEDGPTAPAEVKVLKSTDRGATLSITIHEGRNRQVRRMLEAVGHPVTFLKRVRFGPLDLHGLKLGQHRFLSSAEVSRLRAAAGGARAPRTMRRRGRNVGIEASHPEGPTSPATHNPPAGHTASSGKTPPRWRNQAGLARSGSKRVTRRGT
ncbi:MAG: pseudouridine synthase [Bacillota bacterium]